MAGADNARMKPRLVASIAILLGLAPWLSSRAGEITVYRCTGADTDAAVSLQDTPCPRGQDQETRRLVRPVDAPQAPTPPRAPLAPTQVQEPAPQGLRITRVDPQPLYDCHRFDGTSYESESGVPERRWVPLWVLGMDPRAPPQMFGQVGRPKPAPPASQPGLSTATTDPTLAYGVGAWVEDHCYRLPAQLACERRSSRLRELRRRIFNAGQSEGARLRIEQSGLREQLRQECGID